MSDNKKHGNTGNTYAQKSGEAVSTAKTLITTTEALKAQIKSAAKYEDLPVNAWIRQAIEEKLERS